MKMMLKLRSVNGLPYLKADDEKNQAFEQEILPTAEESL